VQPQKACPFSPFYFVILLYADGVFMPLSRSWSSSSDSLVSTGTTKSLEILIQAPLPFFTFISPNFILFNLGNKGMQERSTGVNFGRSLTFSAAPGVDIFN